MLKVTYTVVDDEIISETRAGVELDYIPAAPGTTSAVTDADQEIVAAWKYWPFGEIASSSGSAATPFKYNGTLGYLTDPGNNLCYVRARYYRPNITRWQTLDALWPDQNPYGYVGGDPINRVDPTGLYFFHAPDCTAGQVDQLTQAFNLLCCKLRPRVRACMSSYRAGIGGTATCSWSGGNMDEFYDFICDSTSRTCPVEISCKHGLGCGGRDALTPAKGLRNTISLCPSAFDDPAAGPLYCIIAHELIHLSSGTAHGAGAFKCLSADRTCGGSTVRE